MTAEPAGGTATTAGRQQGRAPERSRRVVRLRLVLGLSWAAVSLVMLVTAALQPQRSTLDGLYADVSSGEVTAVEIEGGLTGPDEGYATQTARWTVAGGGRTASWWVVRGEGSAPPDEGLAVTRDDVPQELRRLGPDLAVSEVELREGAEVMGVPVAEWAALLLLPPVLAWLGTFWLLVGGPEPYRATRWAWFWLSAPPFGLLAFVVLSGPTPGLGIRRPVGRRLHGGWAFLLTLLLGAALPQPWWW